MFEDHPRLRRSILFGTPLFTGILLVLHPLPQSADIHQTEMPQGLELYEMLAPIADGFLAVHVIFPLALALLGLSVALLLDGTRGIAASLSRVSAFMFVLTYTMYETIVGTVTGLLIRDAAALSSVEQAAIGDAVYRNYTDPLLGDLPSVLAVTAWLSWLLAVTLAAFALRRMGMPLGACILLSLSFIFISHASMLGPLGMLLFLLAATWVDRTKSVAALHPRYETLPSA